MKMLIIEYPDGTADCEDLIPTPGQIDLQKYPQLKCEIVDSQLMALSYLDRPQDSLKIDDESIKQLIKFKILKALDLSDWVQKDAAKLLGIRSVKMSRRCATFNITHEKWLRHGHGGRSKLKVGRKPKLKVVRKTA